ncbi:MAG: radical SAM protein [Candidatus Altiarchaeota archaeon]
MNDEPLARYFKILKGEEKAKFLSCENLDEKIEKAEKIIEDCELCERKCKINRFRKEKGYCKVLEAKIASEFLHFGEEQELIPSYTIFFSGCNFSCIFCQNWDISQFPDSGATIKEEIIARMIAKRAMEGAKNVNWVGGEPTPNLAYILRVLKILKNLNSNIAQIWNSNMYLSLEAMSLLDGIIDIYLTDFKYGNDSCAKKLSNVKNYTAIVKRNHLIAEKQGEVIVRHLVLPGHIECCTKPILEWLSKNMKNFRLNLMDQYRPEYKAFSIKEISRKLSFEEFNEALEIAKELNLKIYEY